MVFLHGNSEKPRWLEPTESANLYELSCLIDLISPIECLPSGLEWLEIAKVLMKICEGSTVLSRWSKTSSWIPSGRPLWHNFIHWNRTACGYTLGAQRNVKASRHPAELWHLCQEWSIRLDVLGNQFLWHDNVMPLLCQQMSHKLNIKMDNQECNSCCG